MFKLTLPGTQWVLIASVLSPCVAGAESSLPILTVPPFPGDRYTDTVPATLDLSERLHLSLNAHTRCVNTSAAKPYPPTKYLANHFILLKPEGPEVFRDVNLYGKAMLGTLLARMVTGSQQGIEVDHNWRASWLEWQKCNPIMHGPEGGRRMEWIAMNVRREQGANQEAWKKLARRAVRRLDEEMLAVSGGD
ncbi:MAG: hypothetical protein CMJ72_04130 [Planctomycetaceae bacterium]|nr:hypothetical protein [Planctomycetaceae bacterium]